MTASLTTDALAGFVEKAPLERYVAPEKPSLVGLSRAAMAGALASVGVPASQRKMRAQQIWNWLYARGATGFEQMTSVSKELRAALAEKFTPGGPDIGAAQVARDGHAK